MFTPTCFVLVSQIIIIIIIIIIMESFGDVTVVCTCADSYVEASAREAGAASELSGVYTLIRRTRIIV